MNTTNNTIIIVSGLPRSGTSLMMQILNSMNIPLFIDKKRLADENNPRGYFEHEFVKNIESDNSWLKEVKGKAVKIVSPHLCYLSKIYKYKIIFMQRDFDEIIQSQNKMLRKNQSDFIPEDPIMLKNIFDKNLNQVNDWLEHQSNIEILFMNFKDLIFNSDHEIKQIKNFLELRINSININQIISPQLYHNRILKE